MLLGAHLVAYLSVVFTVLSPLTGLVFIAVHLGLWGVYMGCSVVPNHKGMPTLPPGHRLDYVRQQVISSRNVSGGRWVDFVLGGLNYQIEHHLFPSMPRPNLCRAQAVVQSFCDRHRIDYAQCGLLRSYGHVLRHLRAVGAPLRSRAAPPPVASMAAGGHGRSSRQPCFPNWWRLCTPGLARSAASPTTSASGSRYHASRPWMAGWSDTRGFHTIDRHTVTAVGTNARRVSLLVVPPHTPGGVARAVLRSAAGSDSTATVEDIMASNGVPPQNGPAAPADAIRPEATEPTPEQRWEAEGGYVRYIEFLNRGGRKCPQRDCCGWESSVSSCSWAPPRLEQFDAEPSSDNPPGSNSR